MRETGSGRVVERGRMTALSGVRRRRVPSALPIVAVATLVILIGVTAWQRVFTHGKLPPSASLKGGAGEIPSDGRSGSERSPSQVLHQPPDDVTGTVGHRARVEGARFVAENLAHIAPIDQRVRPKLESVLGIAIVSMTLVQRLPPGVQREDAMRRLLEQIRLAIAQDLSDDQWLAIGRRFPDLQARL